MFRQKPHFRGRNRHIFLNRREFFSLIIYVETQSTAAKSAPRSQRASAPKRRKSKLRPSGGDLLFPARRAKRPAKPPNARHAARRRQSGGAKVAGQRPAPRRTGALNPVDLTETIKTLLHLSQEHGYITYDDINDILPDNLSPEDLDSLLTKLRSLDVEIVMDQAEAERAERTKQPEQPSRRKPTKMRAWKFWTTRCGCT